ncbi:MAG TPA: PorV/PorQ family protein [bacterium]|nr:PorV/PorQ family protein [bacterium]
MNLRKILMTSICALFILAGNAWTDKTTISGLFLGVPIGAKPTALGGAYTALAEGVYGLYWNPAGIAKTEKTEILFAHNNYFQDVNQQYLGITHKLKNKHNIGLAANILDNGDFDGTLIIDPTSHQNTGRFSAKDYAISFSYAVEWKKNGSFGGSLKYIKSQIKDSKATAVAFDIGWQMTQEIKETPILFGFTVSNIGSKMKFDREREELPLTGRFGISSRFDATEYLCIIPTIDNVLMTNDKYRLNAGVDLEFFKNYSLRAGYNDFNELSSGITLGFGATFSKLTVDYSYSDFGDLKNSHIFSVLYKF